MFLGLWLAFMNVRILSVAAFCVLRSTNYPCRLKDNRWSLEVSEVLQLGLVASLH